MTAADHLAEVEARATKQAAAYARMLELGGGVGALGINEPAMLEDMLAWSNATENDHADTVLRLTAALRAVLNEHEKAQHIDLDYCSRCVDHEGAIWPCMTVRVIEQALGGSAR